MFEYFNVEYVRLELVEVVRLSAILTITPTCKSYTGIYLLYRTVSSTACPDTPLTTIMHLVDQRNDSTDFSNLLILTAGPVKHS